MFSLCTPAQYPVIHVFNHSDFYYDDVVIFFFFLIDVIYLFGFVCLFILETQWV